MSTVTKLRTRLLEEGIIKRVNIPAFQRIGAELFIAGYGELNPYVSLNHRLKVGKELLKSSNTTFLAAGDGDRGFGFSRNYTTAIESILRTEKLADKVQKNPYKGSNYVFASFKLARIFRFFNFALLISEAFGIQDPEFIEPSLYFPLLPSIHLHRRVKTVLAAMVEFPEKNNKELNQITGISRQTISIIRKKLIENEVIGAAYIPNIVMLGFEVFSFVHLKLRSNAVQRIGKETLRRELGLSSVIFSMIHAMDILLLHVSIEFITGKHELFEAMRAAKNAGILREEPMLFMFPASKLIYPIFHDYATPLNFLFSQENSHPAVSL